MALHRAIRVFAQAGAAGDVSVLDTLLSPGYTHTDRLGKLWYRDEWLAQVRPKPIPPKVMDVGHLTATLMGDLGIVTGIKRLHVTGGQPGELESATAYTQLWAWRDERWLRELFQETPIVDDLDVVS